MQRLSAAGDGQRYAAKEVRLSLSSHFTIHQIAPDEIALMEAMLTTFGAAFDEVETYTQHQPSVAYLQRLLGSNYFIAIVVLQDGEVVGGR
jgi:aminoglycoside 3-N-acetyltransferase I